MRVTFLTHYYPPETGAPQARIAAIVRGLAARGVEVHVHTGFPHYPDGSVKRPYRNRLYATEQLDGVPVTRSAVYPAANVGVVKRLADHLAFAASALVTAPATSRADVVVVESPPLFTAGAGIAYAAAKRAALVANIADRWPESAVQLGALTHAQAIRAASALEQRVYRSADLITVPTRGLARALGVEPSAAGKVVRIGPAVDLDRFDPAPPTGHDGPLRVAYAGTVGLAQGLGTLLDAAQLAGPEVVHVQIAGGGAEVDELAAVAPPNVQFLGVVAHESVPALYARADAAVVLLRDRPVFEGALPTKLVEAMAAARPIVVSARGEASEFVTDASAGIAVWPEDPERLAVAFRQLHSSRPMRERLGAAGRAYAEANLGRSASLDRWAEALELAISRRTGRG